MQNLEWLKIKEVFNQTLDLPEFERENFLADFDELVRIEVSELLKSHQQAEKFISEPAVIEFGLNDDRLIGKKIDDYQIMKEIGAGGMGKVYLAQREGFEQKFALKLIKRGMDTEAVLKRFVLERQILSRLEHPNIARLLNVGSTATDLPYFVMEYVEGVPITKFCESHQLSKNERLELFQKVCSAVNYAHQNLIVHRDIKPSNILVTNDGTPKLLDFGIAKLLNSQESEQTATQARILTPEYASPEQLNNLPITTATDVYSLGIVLHELLNGKRPSSVISASKSWSVGRNTEKNQVETQTANNPKSKIQNLKSEGDLGNIIQKSLREEPTRRYQTVQEFSEDIRRFLVGLPVTATADSTFYRFSKFVRRHRQGVIAGALVSVLILTISGVAIWQSITANRERAKAEQRFEQVRKLANIVLFEYHDGIAKLPGATAMREKMVKDSLAFLDNLSAENIENVELQRDIAKAYQKIGDIQGGSDTGNLGKTNDALQSYQKAIAMQEKIVSINSANVEDTAVLGNLNLDIGLQQRSVGDLNGAEKSLQNALNIFSTLPTDFKTQSNLAKTFWNIASLQTAQNNLDGSLKNYGKAVELYEKLAVEDATNKRHLRNVALTNKNIGSVLQLLGQKEKALQHFEKSLAIDAENAKNNPNDVSARLDLSFTYGTIASALRDAKDFQRAIENHQNAIEIREEVFNNDPKNVFAENAVARGFQEFGRTYLANQKYLEAETNFSKAQKIFQKMSDADVGNLTKKANLAENLALLGYVHGLNQSLSKATEAYDKSITIYADLIKQEKLSTLDQRRFAGAYLNFAEVLLKNQQTAKALENLNKAQELLANEKVRKDAKDELAQLERLLKEAKNN